MAVERLACSVSQIAGTKQLRKTKVVMYDFLWFFYQKLRKKKSNHLDSEIIRCRAPAGERTLWSGCPIYSSPPAKSSVNESMPFSPMYDPPMRRGFPSKLLPP